MKRVSICMRGGVSIYQKRTLLDSSCNLKYPNDIYKNKEYVNFTATYNSIKKHIINANPRYEFDFFLHGWNYDLQDVFINLYKPKLYLFEDNTIYREEILKKCAEPEFFSGPSQLLSIKKTIELKEMYEQKHNIVYDIVILYRYDVLLWKDIILSNYNLKYIWSNSLFVPYHAGDFHFIMSTYNASLFKTCYDWISNYKHTNPLSHHSIMYQFITNVLHVTSKSDTIYPILHQEVTRKIHPVTMKSMYYFGITERDINESMVNTHMNFIDLIIISFILSIILYIRHRNKTNILYLLYYISFLILFTFLFQYIMNAYQVFICIMIIFCKLVI